MSIFSKRYYYHISYKAVSDNGSTFDGDTLVTAVNGNLNALRQYVIDTNAKNGMDIKAVVIVGMTVLSRKQYQTLSTK